MSAVRDFLAARDFLLQHRSDYATAYRDFRWPRLEHFNWALDYFDAMAEGNHHPALWIVEEDGREARLSFAELSARSSRVANWLREQGVRRGDRILLMLGNEVPLWETMLAAFKLGAVVIPATTLLTPDDLLDRLERGQVRHVVVGAAHTAKFDPLPGDFGRIAVQTAKQTMMQRLRQAEKEMIYEEFKDRAGDIVSGTVRRFERNDGDAGPERGRG